MLKKVIDIELAMKDNFSQYPWARNYLEHNNLLSIILIIKKKYRHMAIVELLTKSGLEEHLSQIEFNKAGQVVFKWQTKEEKTMFLLKWS